MSINEKLTELLSNEAFFAEHKDLADPEAIISTIQNAVPEATREEIDAFLTQVSKAVSNESELQENELENVAGGFAITLTAAGVITALKVSAAAGTAIGAAVWYWQNRNR